MAAPRRRAAAGVRIDFTSACLAFSSLSAPHPSSRSPSQADQKVISGRRSRSRSRAWTLSGGEISRMLARCSSSRAWTSGRVRSSTSMFMAAGQWVPGDGAGRHCDQKVVGSRRSLDPPGIPQTGAIALAHRLHDSDHLL
ncbi:hypothetical protein VARIO8X_120308 [Burkholderiales bacterium 8X]|nr:hypothetical protein VARIO8X_120308 [Burkholderiales bacterium 8X]